MLTNAISGVCGLGSAAAVGKATKGMTDGSVRKAATEFAIGTTADTGAGITTAVATGQEVNVMDIAANAPLKKDAWQLVASQNLLI